MEKLNISISFRMKRSLRQFSCTFFIVASLTFADSIFAADIKKTKSDIINELHFYSHDEAEAIGTVSRDSSDSMTVFLLGNKSFKDRVLSFNKSILQNKEAGKIEECRSLIQIPVGRVNANTSYGGICLYERDGAFIPVSICNDEMVGHFKMLPLDGPVDQPSGSILQLTEFVINNCFGG